MTTLHRVDHLLAILERVAIVILLSGLIGLGMLQLVLRNLFASGLFWADPVLRHLVLWLAFLGASLATRERRHLSMDALARALPAACQPWLVRLTHLTAMLVCLLLMSAAWRFVLEEYRAGTVLVPGVATWLAGSIMPCAFLIMAWRFALHVLDGPRPVPQPAPCL